MSTELKNVFVLVIEQNSQAEVAFGLESEPPATEM
jgi:hypothetical protein